MEIRRPIATSVDQVSYDRQRCPTQMETHMNIGKSKLDAAFVERQRHYLTRLRASLKTAAQSAESDEANVNAGSMSTADEFEDDAQRLAALELNGNLVVRDIGRLERVERALAKIGN